MDAVTISDVWAREQAEAMYPRDFGYGEDMLYGRASDGVTWTTTEPETGGGLPTSEQYNNLDAVAEQAAAALGLDPSQRSSWTYNDRIAYILEFQATILENQVYFSPEVVHVASNLRTQYQPLDIGAEGDLWAAEQVLDNSVFQAFAGVGNAVLNAINGTSRGISNLGSAGGLVLPVVAIAAAFMLAASASRETKSLLRF